MSLRKASAILRKLSVLPGQDLLLLLEAVFMLAMSSLAIAVVPFRQIGLLATWSIRKEELPHQAVDQARRIQWAITSTAMRLPWRALCFQQGLAAQLMLRRRGVRSVLYYGAAQNDKSGLHAHVWVRYGDMDVVGGELADRFAVLATFPFSTSQSDHMRDSVR